MTDDVCIIRASAEEAHAIANFLLEQDVRPAPRTADVAAFLGREGTIVFSALHDGRIEGVAGCVNDGSAFWLAYFAVEEKRKDLLAPALVGHLASAAAQGGASMLATKAPRDSRDYEILLRCGFEANWEEGDTEAGLVVTMVDLVKVL